MKIKRFLDRDARSAMAQVRAEMGTDAVILSNKTVDNQVELVAAVDLDEASLGAASALYHAGNQNVEMAAASGPTLGDLQAEMGRLRNMLETELSQLAWRDMADKPPVKAALFNRLSKLGLSRTLCGQLVDKLPENGDLRDLWIKALGLLASKLPVTGDSLMEKGGRIALVGSTGVGKTTTIAKLATRFMIRHGNKEVALVTTDCYRIGGQEQLETFARYLSIPMVVATDAKELKRALDQFSDRKLVLIDTAGMSQRDMRLYDQFKTLNSTGYSVDTYVVLSAAAQIGALKEVIKVFGPQVLAGAMVTKVDETTSLGGVLDVITRNKLRVGYVSNGQKVPEDIRPARSENLVATAVDLMEKESREAARDEQRASDSSVVV